MAMEALIVPPAMGVVTMLILLMIKLASFALKSSMATASSAFTMKAEDEIQQTKQIIQAITFFTFVPPQSNLL